MLDSKNSSTTPLAASGSFSGYPSGSGNYISLVVAVKTDQDGELYVEFSPDGNEWDSSLTFEVAAGTRDVHRITITNEFYRVRFTNTSASPQTYFRVTSVLSGNLSSPSILSGAGPSQKKQTPIFLAASSTSSIAIS